MRAISCVVTFFVLAFLVDAKLRSLPVPKSYISLEAKNYDVEYFDALLDNFDLTEGNKFSVK
jgi:hypothetical protein